MYPSIDTKRDGPLRDSKIPRRAVSFGIALANRTTSSAGEDKKALAPSNERSEPLTRFFSERKFQLKVGRPLTGCRASDASEENFSAS